MRILENFNRPEITAFFPAVEITQFNIGDLIPFNERRKICNAYNVIAETINNSDFPKIPTHSPQGVEISRWFTCIELNLIEGIIAYMIFIQSVIAKYGTGNYYGTKIYGGGFLG